MTGVASRFTRLAADMTDAMTRPGGSEGSRDDDMTGEELVEEARNAGVEGRSSMDKSQLVAAVKSRQGHRRAAGRGRPGPPHPAGSATLRVRPTVEELLDEAAKACWPRTATEPFARGDNTHSARHGGVGVPGGWAVAGRRALIANGALRDGFGRVASAATVAGQTARW